MAVRSDATVKYCRRKLFLPGDMFPCPAESLLDRPCHIGLKVGFSKFLDGLRNSHSIIAQVFKFLKGLQKGFGSLFLKKNAGFHALKCTPPAESDHGSRK